MGVGATTLWAGPEQYRQALAQPTRRKLALLIGINPYPGRAIDPILTQDVSLSGCLTDIELQRQLLLHRFGFKPVDIAVLSNQEATRKGILEAIDQHLVQQARPGDVVLLHFSGYGSQVRIDGQAGAAQSAWVPIDSRLPSEDNPALTDILEAELVAKLQPLATANLTTVIDAGSQDVGYLRWGNLRVRSRPTVPTGTWPVIDAQPSTRSPGQSPPWPGLVLRAGAMGNLVLESQWDGFSAGVFTYALTQSLWETLPDPNPKVLVQQAKTRLQQWTGPDQQPAIEGTLSSKSGAMAYFLSTQVPPTDGVVLPTAADRPLTLWLGGIPPTVLRYLQPGSRFLTTPVTGTTRVVLPAVATALRLESRNGLRAVAKIVEGSSTAAAALARQPVYEQVRRLPQTIDLVVALDSQLKRVERVDATSALASVPFVTSITAGDKPADCLFGRLPLGPVTTLTATLPTAPAAGDVMAAPGAAPLAESSYGLFAPNRTLLPGTMLPKEEAVKTAVNRLTPYLQTLLAMKLVRLTQNRTSSWLGATAALETTQPRPQLLIWHQTQRSQFRGATGAATQAPQAPSSPNILSLTSANRILYRLTNQSAQPLHSLLISFNSRGGCAALMAPFKVTEATPDGEATPATIAPGQTQVFPENALGWDVSSPMAWVETYVILSTKPLNQCLARLIQDSSLSLPQATLRRVSQPLKLAQALLQDLHGTAADGEGSPLTTDYYALQQDQWVTFSFDYSVG